MKKYTSTAALALRLTWVRALGVFAAVGIGQWAVYLHGFSEYKGTHLRDLLEGSHSTIGLLGGFALMVVLYITLRGGRSSDTTLTIRRLPLREGTVALLWTGVAAGWFLLYWAFQLGQVIAMYAYGAARLPQGRDTLMLLSYSLHYFHYLLPLSEPWGYARNIALVIGLGSGSVMGARNAWHGRKIPLGMGLVIVMAAMMLIPRDVGSQLEDIWMVAIAAAAMLIDWLWTRGWIRDETD